MKRLHSDWNLDNFYFNFSGVQNSIQEGAAAGHKYLTGQWV